MKKLISLFFAVTMILSIAFVSEVSSGNGPFAAKAQTVTAKRRKRGIARSTYAGGKWVTKRVYRGGKWVTTKTWQGAKWTGKKTYKTGRKVVSRTKKIVY